MNLRHIFIFLVLFSLTASATVVSCTATAPVPTPKRVETPPPQPVPQATKPTPTPTPTPEADPEPETPCPEGMVYIDHVYCTQLHWRCIKKAVIHGIPKSHICKTYDTTSTCIGETRRQRFCIDKYEFPNEKGAHPPVMLSAYDATTICHEQGKRLCWESEWTASCEGSNPRPYPYGFTRDSTKCNIDNMGRNTDPKGMRAKDPAVREDTLRRLDQSVPSGSMEECTSDYKVYDTTGNLSEWVYIERPGGQCTWGAVKGGHWTNTRSICRATGKAHPEAWSFYPLSFRCCKDPRPQATGPVPKDGIPLWTPPAPPVTSPLPGTVLNRGWTPPE